MAFNRDFEINEAQLEDFLKNATDKVRTSENVDLLSDLNKLFKKNVPLTVRKYVIAYLLKEALKHYHPFGNRRERFERNDRNERNERNNRTRQERNFRQERAEHPAETAGDGRPRRRGLRLRPESADVPPRDVRRVQGRPQRHAGGTGSADAGPEGPSVQTRLRHRGAGRV